MIASTTGSVAPITFGSRRALLLQGPMGPFFRRLRAELKAANVAVWKVNFNAGDALFDHCRDCIDFTGRVEQWPSFFEALVRQRGIDTVFLFGDGRVYHRLARTCAERLGVRVFVFEEGYMRPGFVTVERGGVNSRSPMPRDPDEFLRTEPLHRRQMPKPAPENLPPFWHAALYSSLYSMAMTWANWRYPHYEHHRPMHALYEAFAWVRGGARKLVYQRTEASILPELTTRWSGRFFLVPLQVYCDYQLNNAPYESMAELIDGVARDFAANAPPDTALVIKHHPLDRGYTSFQKQVRSLGRELGIADRLFYVHDLHLPTLLKHAAGCVTLNSTVGMDALRHAAPVKVLGEAVYAIAGLTSTQPLASFWSNPEPADPALFKAFRAWLSYHNQARGNFYRLHSTIDSPTTFDWPPAIRALQPDEDSCAACQCTETSAERR